ncbi:MAG TPA: efflux RND transporter periplasmic adaptor subunit [Candidatus Sulfopaludibacter sp.]|nr:efflux RND transporter periplasmic adaptor subunit [Candidatus Sulfopaludibacter sp.]
MSGRYGRFGIIAVVAAALGGMSACSESRRVQATAPETVRNVSVIVAERSKASNWLEAVGTVRAAQTSQVASQLMGTIMEIRAHEGDRVEQGQILAVLDDAQPRAAVEQASAALAAAGKETAAAESDFGLAEATLKRYQQLYEKQSASPQEFDEIKARYQSAEARRDMAVAGQAQARAALTQAQTALGHTQIRAPFGGVVAEKKADAGTLASPGMPLFTIEDTRSYRLEATVDESEILFARLGQIVPVRFDVFGDGRLSGKVAQIVPAADPASRSVLVKVELPADRRLRSGLFGRARFSRGERMTLLIPQTAVVERGQLRGAYVVGGDGIASLRYITLGETAERRVEVLSGLDSGEKLIASPGAREFSGKRIVAQP